MSDLTILDQARASNVVSENVDYEFNAINKVLGLLKILSFYFIFTIQIIPSLR